MAMEPMTQSVSTSRPPDEARTAAMAALQHVGAQLVPTNDGSLQAKSGRKALSRFLGAMFVPDDWLPLAYVLTFAESDGGSTVEMNIHDDFGIGVRSGFKKKYTRLMQHRLSVLAEAVG